MTRQMYVVEDNQWQDFERFNTGEVSEAIYNEVGAKFPIVWRGNRVSIDFDDLPEGVTENDVKQAVRNHHPHR